MRKFLRRFPWIHDFLARKIAADVQVMQDGVQGAWSQVVTMAAKLFHDLHAANRLLVGMVENVQPHEAGKQVSQHLVIHNIEFRY